MIRFEFRIEAKGQTPNLVNQVHGNALSEIKKGSRCVDGDGVWTCEPNRPIYVFTADCLPVLLYSEFPTPLVAALHCGWRGAKEKIVAKAIEDLFPNREVTAVLGPCIKSCCFEVREDFVQAMQQAGHNIDAFLETRNGKLFFSIDKFIIETQLPPNAVVNTQNLKCTFCSSPTVPSYRRQKNTDPRIRSIIEIG